MNWLQIVTGFMLFTGALAFLHKVIAGLNWYEFGVCILVILKFYLWVAAILSGLYLLVEGVWG